MNTRIWKKREGKELTLLLNHMKGATFAGAEVNGNEVGTVYMSLAGAFRDEKINLKIIKAVYSAELQIFEERRPRTGIAEVEIVKKGDDKVVAGFRLKVDENDITIPPGSDVDDKIEESLKDMVKLGCARRIKEAIDNLPEMVDSEQYLNDLRHNCELRIKAKLQNGLNLPMEVNELRESRVAIHEVMDRASEAGISFERKPAPKHDPNEMPF